MCSWCWGYQPEWMRLQAALPDNVKVKYILGGLAPDTDEIMSVPMQQVIAGHWRRIQTELGAEFNFEFWSKCQPKRSTYPACRAVIAARQQNHQQEMIAAIQQAYYLRALNPSETSTLIQIADECGLDSDQFQADLTAEHTQAILSNEIQFTKNAAIHGFPSLALSYQTRLIPIPVDYKNHLVTLTHIQNQLTRVN